MSFDVLKEELRNKKIRNLYLFYGPEEYLKKHYLENIEKAIIDEEFREFNRIVLEDKVDIKKISDCCEMLPIFAKKKIVIVKNSGLLKPKKKVNEAERKNKAQSDDLLKCLESIPDYTCLVFYEMEIDKRMKVVDHIKKNGLIVEFPYQKPIELVKWVMKVFNSHKKEIGQLTASRFVDNSEQGMNEILNEIKKVIMFTGNRVEVNDDDIETVCTKSIKSRIFDLMDAVAEKNGDRALKFLDNIIVLKEPLPKILFMIARQFRHVLEMKLLINDGINRDEAVSRLGITPYAAGKVYKQAGSFTIETLKQIIEECLKLDVAIKTGKINDRIGTELLIVKFAK